MKRLLLVLIATFIVSCGMPKQVILVPRIKNYRCKYTYRVNGRTYCVRKNYHGYVEYGIASWYGPGFHGRRTASGEIYNMYKLTAAHKTLPFGTYVRVINLKNGKSVIVKINDRGPFVSGRIVDLSYAAAREIGMLKTGTASVKLIALGRRIDDRYKPVDVENGRFYVQVGAFRNKLNAYRFRHIVYRIHKVKTRVVNLEGYYRVLAGPVYSYSEAKKFKLQLRNVGLKGSFILRY